MRLGAAIVVAGCVLAFDCSPVSAQQLTQPVMPQFVLNATTAINQELCYWGGVPYSVGARIRSTEAEHDPHVAYRVLTCKDGTWLPE